MLDGYKFGPDISPDDFPRVNLEDTPLYDICEDDTTDVEGGFSGKTKYDEDPDMATLLDRELPTPEVNDNYVKYSVMLPRGDSYARGKFIGQKRDADRNVIGRENYNPILNTREYCVDFDDVKVSELMVNVIAECMYAACDNSGNEYLMMESILYYWKSNKALSVTSQKVVHRGRSFMRRSTVGWQLYVQ